MSSPCARSCDLLQRLRELLARVVRECGFAEMPHARRGVRTTAQVGERAHDRGEAPLPPMVRVAIAFHEAGALRDFACERVVFACHRRKLEHPRVDELVLAMKAQRRSPKAPQARDGVKLKE